MLLTALSSFQRLSEIIQHTMFFTKWPERCLIRGVLYADYAWRQRINLVNHCWKWFLNTWIYNRSRIRFCSVLFSPYLGHTNMLIHSKHLVTFCAHVRKYVLGYVSTNFMHSSCLQLSQPKSQLIHCMHVSLLSVQEYSVVHAKDAPPINSIICYFSVWKQAAKYLWLCSLSCKEKN